MGDVTTAVVLLIKQPRPPRSAYSYFVEKNYRTLATSVKAKPMKPVSTALADKWKNLYWWEYMVYMEKRNEDEKRYRKEKQEWALQFTGKLPRMKKKKKEVDAPKKSRNSFLIFAAEYRPIIKYENPGLELPDLMRVVADMGRAVAQAKELYTAGEKQWGTNESVFNSTMVGTSPIQLQLVFEECRKLAGHDVAQAEFSNDIKDGLLTIIKCNRNKPAYFAERAYQSIQGMGTKYRMLIRVIVSYCDKDMVQIKQEYQRMYKKPLENAICDDTPGKYKEGLLALVKGRCNVDNQDYI